MPPSLLKREMATENQMHYSIEEGGISPLFSGTTEDSLTAQLSKLALPAAMPGFIFAWL